MNSGVGPTNLLWLLFVVWATAPSTFPSWEDADVLSSWEPAINPLVIVSMFVCTQFFLNIQHDPQKQDQDKKQSRQIWRGGSRQPLGSVMVCAVLPSLLHVVMAASKCRRRQNDDPGCYHHRRQVLSWVTLFSSGCLLLLFLMHPPNSSPCQPVLFVLRLAVGIGCALLVKWISLSFMHNDRVNDTLSFFVGLCHGICFMELFRLIFRRNMSILHQVWTMGEWTLVVGLNSLLLVYHCWIDSSSDESNVVYLVARSGFLGALLVCPLVETLWPVRGGEGDNGEHHRKNGHSNNDVTRKATKSVNVEKAVGTITTTSINYPMHNLRFRQDSVWIKVVASAMFVLLFVEVHFWSLGTRRQVEDNQSSHAHQYQPQCLWWLVRYLGQVETSCFVPKTARKLLTWPRYFWIAYWIAALILSLVSIPSLFALVAFSNQQQQSSSTTTQQPKMKQENRNAEEPLPSLSSSSSTSFTALLAFSVTLKRKWFHVVAVILFGPVTLYAPELQALGYTIALAILVLVEGLQLRRHVPVVQTFYRAFLDPLKHEMENEDDGRGSQGKVIVSHLSLIAGCAMPLYFALYLLNDREDVTDEQRRSMFYLSLVGIVGLGIGDAMAAVAGTIYSWWKKHHNPTIQTWEDNFGLSCWGRWNRTWVGSLSMLCSMIWFVWLLDLVLRLWWPATGPQQQDEDIPSSKILWWSWWGPCLLWMTAVEAYTSQLDNLVLPLVGITAFLRQAQRFAGDQSQ
ncbi:hypothetical protein ACA910_013203 [Epithemia clementina (nom. ined.)]